MKALKHQKQPVNDLIYNEAYKNKDNQKIIQSVLSKYRRQLDKDTLKSCGLNALWRCLQSHSDNFKTKFTSSLWRFVNWECKKELQTLARTKYKSTELYDIPIEETSFTIFDELHGLLPPEYCKIVKLRFEHGMTLREIGKVFGYTKESARLKLQHALKQIKQVVYNNVDKGSGTPLN